MAAEKGLIKNADLAKAREVDFVYRFQDGIKKLIEVLGITKKIPKVAGTNLKAYKATGTLLDGIVAEGDIIPLSHYKTVPVTFAEITLKNKVIKKFKAGKTYTVKITYLKDTIKTKLKVKK
jgi:hypothetical protein